MRNRCFYNAVTEAGEEGSSRARLEAVGEENASLIQRSVLSFLSMICLYDADNQRN